MVLQWDAQASKLHRERSRTRSLQTNDLAGYYAASVGAGPEGSLDHTYRSEASVVTFSTASGNAQAAQ